MTSEETQLWIQKLDDDWTYRKPQNQIHREFKFKGFATAVQLANLCAWLADREGHHPDIEFGWGYVRVSLTTHDAGGVTENDFRWAEKLDKILAVGN